MDVLLPRSTMTTLECMKVVEMYHLISTPFKFSQTSGLILPSQLVWVKLLVTMRTLTPWWTAFKRAANTGNCSSFCSSMVQPMHMLQVLLKLVHLLQLLNPAAARGGKEDKSLLHDLPSGRCVFLTWRVEVDAFFCRLDEFHVSVDGMVWREERCHGAFCVAFLNLELSHVVVDLVIVARWTVTFNGSCKYQEPKDPVDYFHLLALLTNSSLPACDCFL